jgi:hypothetical protein
LSGFTTKSHLEGRPLKHKSVEQNRMNSPVFSLRSYTAPLIIYLIHK